MKASRGLTLLMTLMVWFLASQAKAEVFQNQKLEIVFKGNRVFSSQQLIAETTNCLAQGQKSKGEYNPAMLDYCMRTVGNLIRAGGYLRAVVGEPKLTEEGNRLRITVPIEEGPLYRLGEIKIEGARLFSPFQIREMLKLNKGDVARSDLLGNWLFELVKKTYLDRGYIEYTAEIQPSFRLTETAEGLVDLNIDIEEGNLFTFGPIRFSGNTSVSEQSLADALMIREGEPFSNERVDEAVQKLNTFGLFELIDRGKDVEVTKEKGRRFGITIRVKEALREKDAPKSTRVNLSVQDPRPIAKAIELLENKYGSVITYEDPCYEHASEIEDVTETVRRDLDKYEPGKAPRVLGPKGGVLIIDYDVLSDTGLPLDREAVLHQLLNANSANGNAGRFRLEKTGEVLHVIPTESKSKAGTFAPQESVLDAVISLPEEDRSSMQMLEAICAAVSQATQTPVEVGIVPLNLFLQHRDQRGAVSEKARNVLLNTLEKTGRNLSWQLYYGPGTKRYVLNIHQVAPANRYAAKDYPH